MSSGFSAAEGRAYDAWKTSGPDEDGGGNCPTCGGESFNTGMDTDGERQWKCTEPCDDCNATCDNCGETGAKHEGGKYCEGCAPLARICECGATLDEGQEDFSFCRKCD